MLPPKPIDGECGKIVVETLVVVMNLDMLAVTLLHRQADVPNCAAEGDYMSNMDLPPSDTESEAEDPDEGDDGQTSPRTEAGHLAERLSDAHLHTAGPDTGGHQKQGGQHDMEHLHAKSLETKS